MKRDFEVVTVVAAVSEYKPGDVVAVKATVTHGGPHGWYVLRMPTSSGPYAAPAQIVDLNPDDVAPWPDAVRMEGAVALLRRWVQIRVPEDLHPDLRAETVAFLTALPEREAKPQ